MNVSRSIALGLVLAASSLGLVSCMTMEPEREDVAAGYTSAQFSEKFGDVARESAWWAGLGSAQLDGLMEQAFAGSLTLEQAAARLEQAEAVARKSGAAAKLQLGARGESSSRHTSTAEGSSTQNAHGLGLYASYELDLWGRLKSTERAALANWEASKDDLQTAAMTLSGALATTYVRWLAQSEALALYESQLDSNRKKLAALERRFRTGQATSLAVLQQRQQVAASEARIPPVRAVIEESKHRIAVLTGRVPGTELGVVVEPLPELPPRPDTGLPVELLERRPDVRSARQRLAAADWQVGAARAARLPSLSLTGSIATSGEKVEQLFEDWASNLAASLLAPLLDGGARKAEVDRTLAVSRERIAAYQLAVLEAIRETEDALSNETNQAEYAAALGRQYVAARNSETESIRRYQRGILPYLDTLTAIVLRENLEITTVQAKADLLSNRIQLYRSLGGDWTFILEQK